MAIGRSPIAGPFAEPPRVGLIAQARVIDNDTTSRWEAGFAFDPENCGAAVGVTDPCETTTKTIPANDDADKVTVDPFVVWAGDRCSSFGSTARDYEARARRLLRACESKQIEDEFWSATIMDGNPHLASPGADVVTPGAAQTPQIALRCLEQGLADCGCGSRGMIHANRQLVNAWSQDGLVRNDGSTIVTVNGTIVVSGAGYDGSSPDGEPAVSGSVWAYATGIVYVRLSPIEVFTKNLGEGVNRQTNVIEIRAERLAAAYWDGCCHLAARVNLELCPIGGS